MEPAMAPAVRRYPFQEVSQLPPEADVGVHQTFGPPGTGYKIVMS